MSIRVIGDLGSCHMGKLSYCKKAVEIAKDIGMDVLKFQLFPPKFRKGGNIEFPQPWERTWEELVEYSDKLGQKISASVFSLRALETLLLFKPPFVKFSYSQRKNTSMQKIVRDMGIEVIVSCDPLSDRVDGTKLYCIPEYPVRYEVAFDEIFPRFDGFSDHTLGYRQTVRAAQFGAKTIEKHMKLDFADINCPDSGFALSPKDFEKMIRLMK